MVCQTMGSLPPGWTTQHVSAVDGVVLGGMGVPYEELVRFSPFIVVLLKAWDAQVHGDIFRSHLPFP